MKPEVFFSVSVWVVRTALVTGLGVGCISCSLPPRQAWQRMKDEGIMKAFFMPKRMIPDDRTQRLAGADLSVGEGKPGASEVVPVAEPSDHPGYVYSPRTSTRKLVNVSDFAPGEVVLCPYTMEPFRMPGGAVEIAATVGAASAASGTAFGPEVPLPPPTPVHDASDMVVAGNLAVEEIKVDAPLDGPTETTLFPPASTAPFGSWVAGKPGLVYSPFAARHQLVDVTGLGAGVEVHCPFSGLIFRVPEPAVAVDLATLAAATPEAPGPETSPVAPVDPSVPGTEPAVVSSGKAVARESGTPTPGTGAPKYGASRPPPTPSSPVPAPVPASTPPADQKRPAPPPATPTSETPIPTAVWVPAKLGLVQSPFGKPGEWVDVTGKPSGSKVVCPYTNKPFLVPNP